MKYSVTHTTTYRYSEPVPLGHNQARLTPRAFQRQRCESTQLTISPAPHAQESWLDYFGNPVTYFTVETEHRELCVAARSVVQLFKPHDPRDNATPPWEAARDRVALVNDARDEESRATVQFTFDSPLVRRSPEAAEYAAVSFSPGRSLLDAVLDLTARIYREFKFDPAATSVNTPTAEVFKKRRGVCQDFAHLQITCLRSLRLPARYVSGYLVTDPPPGQPKMIGADASHAWLSVFFPGHGWLDFDPTNNRMPDLRYVTLAWGRDYSDVCPIKGLFLGGGSHTMHVAVDVVPVS